MADSITVEVAYAGPDRQFTYRLNLPAGSTVMQAIEASGLSQAVPGLVIDPSRLGVFSRKVAPNQVLNEGDRVEVYRPLTLDPKEARRRRAHEG